MYIETVPNRNSPPAILLREGWREGKKVRKRTIANLSHWPPEKIEALRLVLKGTKMVPVDTLFEKLQSRLHGHCDAVLRTVRKVGLDKVISAKRCRERDIILGVIVAHICMPDSKLAMTRWWLDTTLPEILGLKGVDEDDIYAAMDWLLNRQGRIEKKLAKRHLQDGDMVLYDLTSSYFEGVTCPLARRGHNRDKKKGKLQVNYGLLADKRGCPVAVSVFSGDTGDPTTLMPQVEKMRDDFGIEKMVLVGDRGMLSQTKIDLIREITGIDWITALKTGAIRKLFKGGALQLGLFDERNLFELTHEDYPGERLVACRNPELARLRAHKRESMLEATSKELDMVRGMAGRGKLKGADKIGVRVGKVVDKYKMAKHLILDIRDDGFDFSIDHESVAAEAALDGIYLIRTSLPKEEMSAEDAVRSYKSLSEVERAFRSLKGVDLMIRPIRHSTEDHVRAHIFLSVLAYYVMWHMLGALRPLLFSDEDQEAKKTRDPVAPARRSDKAMDKVKKKKLDDGSAVHSLHTLLHHMSTITRDLCRHKGDEDSSHTFIADTTPNEKQRMVFELLSQISV